MPAFPQPLLVASNRLPATVARDDTGNWNVAPASGGLVTAMAPVMSENGGVWIGWPGCPQDAPAESLLTEYSRQQHFDLKPVMLAETEIDGFYRGFSNRTIWPLFHDLLGHCTFDASEWGAYCDVNRRYAQSVAPNIREEAFVWIHDYQLLLVGHFLRELGVTSPLSFFLHIPFPSRDLFRRLPWRNEIMTALLRYDHLGFQTRRDLRNFVQGVRTFVDGAVIRTRGVRSFIEHDGRTVVLGHYPISIDFEEFNQGARTHEAEDAAWFIAENHHSPSLMLGLDRLDYTKGIPERFLAFERALDKYPELQGQLSLIQVVIPSRASVPDYQELKEQLDRLAGRINGQYSRHGWIPLHYMYRRLDRTQLLGYYRACEIALITPLRDGMNLVCKEFCASSVDNNGVLILSEFAGAADQMARGAILVNPYDLESTADAIYAAHIMDRAERRRRMHLLRGEVRRNNVNRWLEHFLKRQSGYPYDRRRR